MAETAFPHARTWPRWSAWALALGLFLVLWLGGKDVAPWAFDWPKAQTLPAARWITAFTKWLLNEASFGLFTFAELTRFIAAVIDFPYRVVLSLLSTGFLKGQGSGAVEIVPPLSWIAVIVVFALMGAWPGGGAWPCWSPPALSSSRSSGSGKVPW